MSDKAHIRLISPWSKFVETPQAVFSSDIHPHEADALLCEWAPADELFAFPGSKAWYCCEPLSQFKLMGGGKWARLRSRLGKGEFLYHDHPDSRYRVPHITHFEPLQMNRRADRIDRAVAIVSNFGGGPLRRNPHLDYRNHFITHPLADLFGRASWRQYRERLLSPPRGPQNYRGEIAGDWPAAKKRELLTQYKVCICLESSLEPNYFSEKLVEAVSAGCIPIYRAHDTLRNTVLSGAMWVDPTDYNDDPGRTIQAALEMSIEEFWYANSEWLSADSVGNTHHCAVFDRIGGILVDRARMNGAC